MKRRVVVTGIGAVTSLSCRVDELWTRICDGESGVGLISRFDTSKFRVNIGGEIHDWPIGEYLTPKDCKRLDRAVQFAMVAGIDAVHDSGVAFDKEDPFRCGAIVGSGIGGLDTIEVQHTRLLGKGPDKVSAFTIPRLMANAASGAISAVRRLPWAAPNRAMAPIGVKLGR